MFSFDVHEDIRLTHDAAVEKDEVSLLCSVWQIAIFSAQIEIDNVPLLVSTVSRWKGYREELVQSEQT